MKPLSFIGLLFPIVLATPAIPQGIDLNRTLQGLADEIIRQGAQNRSPSNPGPPASQRPERRSPATQPIVRNEPRTQAPAQTIDVRSIQQSLAQLGYAPGVADGLMGPNTRRAIRDFQRDRGFAVTGRPSSQLLGRLRAAAASPPSQPAVAGTTARPSFDCAKAGTPVEHAICGSDALADRDRQLAAVYSRAFANSSDPARLRSEQQAWLSRRDDCGADADCLADAMDARIAALGGRADHPAQQADTHATPEAGGAGAMASFSEDVYLVALAEGFRRSSHHVVLPACLDPAEAQSLKPAIDSAISASSDVANQDYAGQTITLLQIQGDNSYVLVAGRCLERLRYAQERGWIVSHRVV